MTNQATTQSMDDPFYPDLLTDDENESIRRSPIWPLVLAAHHRSGRQTYATAITYQNKACSVTLSTLGGHGRSSVSFNGQSYSLGQSGNATMQTLMKNIHSTKSGTTGDMIFKRTGEQVLWGHRARIAAVFNSQRGNMRNISFPNLHMDMELTPEVYRVLLEPGHILTPGTVSKLKVAYGEYLSARTSREKYQEVMVRMVQTPKWIVTPPPHVSTQSPAGKLWTISCDNLSGIPKDRFLETMTAKDIPPMTALIPSRLYKWDAIDPVISNELKGALTFYKIYRQGLGRSETFFDEEQMVPNADCFHPDINALTVGAGELRIVMCDRLYQGAGA